MRGLAHVGGGEDKNTKWFHSKASHRKKRNMIKGIMDNSEKWVVDEDHAGNVAINYFC